jgi:hypothetical protein
MLIVWKGFLLVLFGLMSLQFSYNFWAALRNQKKVLEKYPQSGMFLVYWIAINVASIFCSVHAMVMVWDHWPLALLVGSLPLLGLCVAVLENRIQARRSH